MAEPEDMTGVRYVRDWQEGGDSRLTRGLSLWRDAEGLVWLTPAEVKALGLTTAMRLAIENPAYRAPEEETRTDDLRPPSEGDATATSADDWFGGTLSDAGPLPPDATPRFDAQAAIFDPSNRYAGPPTTGPTVEGMSPMPPAWEAAPTHPAAKDPYWECLGWPVGPHEDGSGSPGAPDGPHAYREVPEGAACDLCGLTRDDPRARRNVEELSEGTLAAWRAGQQRARQRAEWAGPSVVESSLTGVHPPLAHREIPGRVDAPPGLTEEEARTWHAVRERMVAPFRMPSLRTDDESIAGPMLDAAAEEMARLYAAVERTGPHPGTDRPEGPAREEWDDVYDSALSYYKDETRAIAAAQEATGLQARPVSREHGESFLDVDGLWKPKADHPGWRERVVPNGPTPGEATTDEVPLILDAAGLDGYSTDPFLPPSGEAEGWRWWWVMDAYAPGGRLLAYDNRPLAQAAEADGWRALKDRGEPWPTLTQGAVPVAVLRAAMLATWPSPRVSGQRRRADGSVVTETGPIDA